MNKEDWDKRIIYLLALDLRVRESSRSIMRVKSAACWGGTCAVVSDRK